MWHPSPKPNLWVALIVQNSGNGLVVFTFFSLLKKTNDTRLTSELMLFLFGMFLLGAGCVELGRSMEYRYEPEKYPKDKVKP